jgi:hypothetical protein
MVRLTAAAALLCALPVGAADFVLTDYGAAPDGRPATAAFAAAFAAAEKAGGGRVVVPAGRWVSGAIHLRSNCEFHLAKGAEIVFTQNPADYLPAVRSSIEGVECWNYSPLVYAYGCTNIAITGSGTLRAFEGGFAQTLWKTWVPQAAGIGASRRQLAAWAAAGTPVAERQIWKRPAAHTRPPLLQINRCGNVRLEGFRVRESPFWTIHLYHSDDIVVRGLDVYARGNNTDGIDIEMCRNVLVEKCRFDQGDDGIVIKSGRDRDGWRLNRPTENVTVRNCQIVNAHTVLAVGSELSGGVRNVLMENCTAGAVSRVYYVKTNRGRGGFVENVVMRRVRAERAREAVVALETDVTYEWAGFPSENRPTRIANLLVDSVSCRKAKRRIWLKGDAASPVKGVRVNWLSVGAVGVPGDVVENVEGFVENVYRPVNYNPAKIHPYTLENPLTFLDGSPVTSPADWPRRRREILDLFAREMYGAEPPPPETVKVKLLEEKTAVAGFAVRRRYRLTFRRDGGGPAVDWIVWTPRHAKKPVPVILKLNYRGAHEFDTDSAVQPPKTWTRRSRATAGHRLTEATRASRLDQNADSILPLQMILARGYAFMTACYCDVSPDPTADEGDVRCQQSAFPYTGVFELWGPRDYGRTDNITSLGAWAWALSRGLDLAARVPGIDATRNVVTGYSRLGKAALIAAARDERFTVCVPVQTGGGGCPLAKRDYGENPSVVNRAFTHWYCAAYAKYSAAPWKLLPFDQHLFLAALAPRALLICGFDEKWYDTEGEFLAAQAASPAWKLHGDAGLPAVPWPGDFETSAVGRRLGYVRRSQGHGISGWDWTWLLDFADGNLKTGAAR